MSLWMNPFKRHDNETFLGVVVPLSEARRFSHSIPAADEETAGKDDKKLDRVGSEENGIASNPEYSSMTIEAIRAEVDGEIASSGHDTAYDRTFLA
jgi:hypothetical protein